MEILDSVIAAMRSLLAYRGTTAKSDNRGYKSVSVYLDRVPTSISLSVRRLQVPLVKVSAIEKG